MERVSQAIRIKGFREGILISIESGNFEESLAALAAELQSKQGFLNGSRVTLDVGRLRLASGQMTRLKDMLFGHEMELWTVLAERDDTKEAAREIGLATRLPGSNVDLDGNLLAASHQEEKSPPGETLTAEPAGANALFLHETLRSGRSIFHDGPVLIIGDVNPGAEVIAGGDVVVWGKLRGLVHAGAMGDGTAVICALDLSPTQLRIADQIAIPPGGQRRKTLPEQASIQDGQIVAEPWRAKQQG